MTRAQRSAHAAIARVLAVVLFALMGLAFYRRSIAIANEQNTAPHTAASSGP